MEHINNISDPFLRDWMTILSLCAIGFFFLIRWSITWISQVRQKASDKHSDESSRVEKYLHDEVERIRAENAKLAAENRAILTDSIRTTNDLSRFQMKVRDMLAHIRYLESVLQRNKIKFTPAESDYDV
jgi:hypothetical protein